MEDWIPIHDGSVIKLQDALSGRGITDENENVIHFNADDFPNFHIEQNGYSTLEGLQNAPVTLRIAKIPEQQQQAQESQTKNQLERTNTIKSKVKEKEKRR